MEKEHWKAVYGGRYEVSSLGRVKRLKRAKGTRKGKVLRTYLKWTDTRERKYPVVAVSVGNGWTRQVFVHRLVAEAFIGPCPKGYVINHKDGNKLNNAVSNLEFLTVRENALHASKLGLLCHGEDHAGAKITEKDAVDIREAAVSGVSYRVLGGRYGLNRSTLHSIVHHKTWKHVGGPKPSGKMLQNKAKLSEEEVRKIRYLYSEGIPLVRLCEMFGVTSGTIHPLVKGKTWKHVK